MTKPTRVPWPLLLLLVLCHQSWGGVVEKFTKGNTVTLSGAHDSVQKELLAQNDSNNRKLKVEDTLYENLRYIVLDELKLSFDGPEREPTSNSSRADFPCPDAVAIAPCVCTVDADNQIDLNCTFVESEEQLAVVFQQDFPVKELHGFYMEFNNVIKLLGSDHSGVSFEIIDLSPGPFALQAISDYFLLDSRLTLRNLHIENSDLLSDGFPFITLAGMETLDSFTIRGNGLTWIPKIYSPMIQELTFAHGRIDVVEPGSFDDAINLSFLGLEVNFLTNIRAGTIPIHDGPMTFFGYGNGLKVIEPAAFFFIDANSTASSGELFIDLSYNGLQSLQAGTIPLRNGIVTIYLFANSIASIAPGTFVPSEESGTTRNGGLFINLHDNLLQSLEAGTIPLRNGPMTIYLYHNLISSIKPGAFIFPPATDYFNLNLRLYGNQLTTFDEAVFVDLMPFITELELHDNPLTCGCDIAWLVLNAAYMAVVDEFAACADGTNLHDLDPQEYLDFC